MKNRLGLSALFVALYTNSYLDKTMVKKTMEADTLVLQPIVVQL